MPTPRDSMRTSLFGATLRKATSVLAGLLLAVALAPAAYASRTISVENEGLWFYVSFRCYTKDGAHVSGIMAQQREHRHKIVVQGIQWTHPRVRPHQPQGSGLPELREDLADLLQQAMCSVQIDVHCGNRQQPARLGLRSALRPLQVALGNTSDPGKYQNAESCARAEPERVLNKAFALHAECWADSRDHPLSRKRIAYLLSTRSRRRCK